MSCPSTTNPPTTGGAEHRTAARRAGMPPPTRRGRRRWLGAVAALLLAAATVSPAGATETEDFLVPPGSSIDGLAVEPIAVIDLDNGDQISFIAVPDARGGIAGVLVSELRSPDRLPLRSLPGLEDANPAELYAALAPKDAPGIAQLDSLYAVGEAPSRQPGWARDELLGGAPVGVSCPAHGVETWGDALDSYSAAFGHDAFESTWNGPNETPQHWATIPGNGLGGLQNRELNGQASDVTAYFGTVVYCHEDIDNAATYNGNYVGNYVQTRWRPAGTNTWNFGTQYQLEDPGDVVDHLWYPGDFASPGADKFDFRMTITQAKPDDLFHIGATWHHGGPTGLAIR